MKGPNTIDFFEKGATVNSAFYYQLLRKNSPYSLNVSHIYIYIYIYISYLPNPSARAGYDTRSIFKRSLAGLNSEFSFS